MRPPGNGLHTPNELESPPITIKFFYDVPVYRLAEGEYEREKKIHIERTLFPEDSPFRDELMAEDRNDPSMYSGTRALLAQSYGGMWLFNEIIGWIRLHFLGTQVRGEYYAVPRRHIIRTRRKKLEFLTWKLAPEREIPVSSNSEQVYSIILKYLDDCRRELHRRYIDSSGLESIGPYVNWKALYDTR